MEKSGRDISIIIPAFNEEESLPVLLEKVHKICADHEFNHEVLLIDDGSTDQTFEVAQEIAKENEWLRIIRFRKNYGKSAALDVGFRHVGGDYVITMDADLQDDPSEIPRLYKKLITENWDLISGWKKKRYDSMTKTVPSKLFNYVTSKMVGLRLHDYNCGFKIYRKEVVKEIEVYGELHRYIPALAHLSGFKVAEMPVQHHPRKFGKSKFGLDRFLKGFLDLLSVLFVYRYMRRPLHFFGGLGVLFLLVGMSINIWLTIGWFKGTIVISERPILFLGILLIILGIQFMSTGLLGEMMTKIFHRVEKYSIKEKINFPL